ncbi:MAG TPA: methionine aminotransferase [Woeseiaceae bacterium]|nr:methionine aminotransferase [Woeseiaceae bacterium]
MQPTLKSKLPNVGTTIFTVMSQLAHEHGAINLSQGFPSFSPPAELTDMIGHYLKHGNNQYAPMPGVLTLREAIAEKTRRFQGRTVNAETEITVCSGATEALFSTIQAVVRRGDEVIVFDPAYDLYEPAIQLAGGICRHVPLGLAAGSLDFIPDWQQLEESISNKTRLIVCNFPHNPTGAILDSTDLDRLASLVRDTGILLLADEVYEHIVFDENTHTSLLSHEELWPRTFIVSSFGKTLHATGWKIGYCIAPAALSAELRRVHQFTVFAVNTPIQNALAEYLGSDPGFIDSLASFYQQKRDLFCRLFQGSRFKLQPARSTFFQLVDYADISAEGDVDIARRWTREIGVASIPLSVFCATPTARRLLRFCFAKDDATLTDAVERLRALS